MTQSDREQAKAFGQGPLPAAVRQRSFVLWLGAILFVELAFLLLSFVYGVLKIPSLVNSIFSGRSGESALPRAIG